MTEQLPVLLQLENMGFVIDCLDMPNCLSGVWQELLLWMQTCVFSLRTGLRGRYSRRLDQRPRAVDLLYRVLWHVCMET